MTLLLGASSSGPTVPDLITFVVCAAMVLGGGIGVVTSRNAVHAALMLVLTLFGIAVLFVEQNASFLAAVQVIVYAGAIVVLFLFVIMFLGVDRREDIDYEPLKLQRPLALLLVAIAVAGVLVLAGHAHWATGAHSVAGSTGGPGSDTAKLGRSVFTTYLFAFEATAGLLVIAVVGAVVLARRPTDPDPGTDEPSPSLEEGRRPGGTASGEDGDAGAVAEGAGGPQSFPAGDSDGEGQSEHQREPQHEEVGG
jgi:NADH-quinone oxidoreductase subunit J